MDKMVVQVEFEGETSQKTSQDSTTPSMVTNEYPNSDDKGDESEQPNSIATGRERRQIWPPQKYSDSDLVSFALKTTDEMGIQEPSSFFKATTCGDSGQWAIAITKELLSLHKIETKDVVNSLKVI